MISDGIQLMELHTELHTDTHREAERETGGRGWE